MASLTLWHIIQGERQLDSMLFIITLTLCLSGKNLALKFSLWNTTLVHRGVLVFPLGYATLRSD